MRASDTDLPVSVFVSKIEIVALVTKTNMGFCMDIGQKFTINAKNSFENLKII